MVFSKTLVTEYSILEKCISRGKYFFKSLTLNAESVHGMRSVSCHSFKIGMLYSGPTHGQNNKIVLLENISSFS